MWPFRGMLVRNKASEDARTAGHSMRTDFCYYFGDAAPLEELGMSNALSAYAFLLDAHGRVRWRGSGKPTEDEINTLLQATEQLAAAK